MRWGFFKHCAGHESSFHKVAEQLYTSDKFKIQFLPLVVAAAIALQLVLVLFVNVLTYVSEILHLCFSCYDNWKWMFHLDMIKES